MPAHSSLPSEKLAATKAMQFIPEDEELVEIEMGEKQEQKRSPFPGLLRRSRRDFTNDEVEELDQIKFRELLALNLPDWHLALLGVICSTLLGALFPAMAIFYSGFLEVGSCSTSPNIFLVCFC